MLSNRPNKALNSIRPEPPVAPSSSPATPLLSTRPSEWPTMDVQQWQPPRAFRLRPVRRPIFRRFASSCRCVYDAPRQSHWPHAVRSAPDTDDQSLPVQCQSEQQLNEPLAQARYRRCRTGSVSLTITYLPFVPCTGPFSLRQFRHCGLSPLFRPRFQLSRLVASGLQRVHLVRQRQVRVEHRRVE